MFNHILRHIVSTYMYRKSARVLVRSKVRAFSISTREVKGVNQSPQIPKIMPGVTGGIHQTLSTDVKAEHVTVPQLYRLSGEVIHSYTCLGTALLLSLSPRLTFKLDPKIPYTFFMKTEVFRQQHTRLQPFMRGLTFRLSRIIHLIDCACPHNMYRQKRVSMNNKCCCINFASLTATLQSIQ